MTTENRIDYQSSQIASLEAKFSALGNQADDQRSEGELHSAPQQTVDPKGRKIWEAQWRGDYGVLLAYVPINALVIDGENVEVEADDKDGDEVTVTAGSWYLHVYKNETTGSYEADFDDSETGTRDGEDAKYNIRILDIHNDGYVEKQYVVGSIVLGKGGVTSLNGDDEDSEKVDGDVLIDGHKCGLVVKTKIVEDENGKPKAVVYIDVKGRADATGCDNTENWGCQPITLPGGGLAHYLGCRPLDLSNLGGGGGGGGGDDPDDPDDPTDDDEVVTSLNGEKGDLVLRLLEGWLEIVKGGQAVKAVGTVATSVSGLIGDMAVIGGKKIRVEQEGNSLKISYDDDKETDDINPFPDSADECSHPDGGGGVVAGDGAGGGVQGGGGESGGGETCCGGTGAGPGSGSPGVSTAGDGKGAQSGTVVKVDGNGETTTGTSSPGKQKTPGGDASAKGRKITDNDIHRMNGPSIKGKKLGDGDIRKFENNDSRSNGSDGRIGVTSDIHRLINNDPRAETSKRI